MVWLAPDVLFYVGNPETTTCFDPKTLSLGSEHGTKTLQAKQPPCTGVAGADHGSLARGPACLLSQATYPKPRTLKPQTHCYSPRLGSHGICRRSLLELIPELRGLVSAQTWRRDLVLSIRRLRVPCRPMRLSWNSGPCSWEPTTGVHTRVRRCRNSRISYSMQSNIEVRA